MHVVYACSAWVIMTVAMVVRRKMPVNTTVVVRMLMRMSVIWSIRWLGITTAATVIMIHVESAVVVHHRCCSVMWSRRSTMSWSVMMLMMVVVMVVVMTFT